MGPVVWKVAHLWGVSRVLPDRHCGNLGKRIYSFFRRRGPNVYDTIIVIRSVCHLHILFWRPSRP